MSCRGWDEWVRQLEEIQFFATAPSGKDLNAGTSGEDMQCWSLYSRCDPQQQHKMNQSIIRGEYDMSESCGKIWNGNWYTKIICLPWDAFLASLLSRVISQSASHFSVVLWVSECVCMCAGISQLCPSACCRQKLKWRASTLKTPTIGVWVSERLIKWLTLMKSICATGFLHGCPTIERTRNS